MKLISTKTVNWHIAIQLQGDFMNRNINTVITACLILVTVSFMMTNDVFSKENNKSRQEGKGPDNNSYKSLLTVEMPQGIICGRPTDSSITLNVYAPGDMEFYIECGLDNSKYSDKTSIYKLSAKHAENITINGLKSNSRYYYRVLTKNIEEGDFAASSQYSFHTCRAKGSDFCFVVQADSHLDEQSDIELYKRTLSNELVDKPDFMIDLGDTFMTDKLGETNHSKIQNRYLMQRGFFSLITHSVPLYLVLGNHDGETGWKFDGTENNITVQSAKTRKAYFPNPQPDDFYLGNNTNEKFVGLPENYYAWTWGDALFVVLDPYWYTVKKPGRAIDNWGWTLGDKQYSWVKDTLEKSNAKLKFVFCHQLIGGGDEGRGGIEFVKYYEMGGFNEDGTWGFNEKRPGWDKPIHQLMADNKVTIFFHGHDHFFAKQELDGIIYQLVPQPSHTNFKNAGQAQGYGYITGDILPNSGYLRVTISESKTTVDYIRTYLPKDESDHRKNGETAYSYN